MNPFSISNNRNSSVELFRIIATLLVLLVHFNGWFISIKGDLSVSGISQVVIESFSCICVNCFLIITGWFGAHLKLKTIWNLTVQLLIVYVPLFFISCFTIGEFSLKGFLNSILVYSYGNYFAQNYFMLVIFTPILNTFIEKYGKRIFKWMVLVVLLEFWFSCIRNRTDCIPFKEGYSFVHFVIMYLLSRLAYEYRDILGTLKKRKYIFIFLFCTMLLTLFYFIHVKWTFFYSNPIVIISSFCLFFPFAFMNFKSKVVDFSQDLLLLFSFCIQHRLYVNI